MGGPGGIGGWDMNGPLGMVSVGQVGVEQALRCGYACIVPGSLLDCRPHRPWERQGLPPELTNQGFGDRPWGTS